MKHCPNRNCPDFKELEKAAEYEDSALTCHRCATPLVDGPAPEIAERELVCVYSSADFYEAEVVKGALKAAGIRVRAMPEDLFGVMGGVPPSECAPELWVNEKDVERARSILANAQQQHHHKAWHCAKCGAKVSGDLVECWKCTARRPHKAKETPAAAVEPPTP